jgi:AraC-like DNA-binding protein
MRLESQLGHGSVFHVALPLPRIHAHAPGAHLPRPPAILLVATSADDQVLAGLCRRQELLPYHVAADEQLDRLFTAVQPVALVCDVDQARAHDWSLIEQIRLHSQGCMVPLLLYNPLETATDGTWLTRVLIKPFRSTQLLDMVMAAGSEASVRSVLIVDDDPESCAFYQQLVASVLPAASLRVAHDGAAALALLAHEVPSLLILDLVMPGVDGFAVLQHLRADARTRNLPVMVLSGKVLSPEDLRRLTYHQVVYQSKDLLTADELAGQIRRANRGALTRSPQTSRLVKHAVAYLQTHHQRPISRQEIADSLGINQTYLSEIFQQELGLTPWDYLNRYRIKQAKSLLRDGSRSVTEVADSVGFNDPSYFGRVFRRIVGCSPQAYRGRPLSGE